MSTDLQKLDKEQLVEELINAYAEAKPLNDKMVDASLKVLRISTEIYQRAIITQLPGIRIDKTKAVLKLGCSINPKTGLPKLAQCLEDLKKAGQRVTHVVYEETLSEFTFHVETIPSAAPELAPQ